MERVIVGVQHADTPGTRAFLGSVAAGDWAAAATLMDEHWTELWFAVDPTDLRHILSAAPAELLARLRSAGFLAALTGHQAAGPGPSAAPRPGDVQGIVRHVADLRLRGRPSEAMSWAPRLVRAATEIGGRLVDASGGWVGLMFVHGGSTALLAGDLVTARGLLQTATATRRPDRFPFVPRDAAAKLALAHAIEGDVPAARDWSTRAAQCPRTASWAETLIDDTVWLTEYVCAVDVLDLEQAEAMRRARPSPLDHLEYWGPALQAHVRHLVLTDRRAQASALCDEVAAAGLPLEGSDGWVATMLAEARLMAADGAVPDEHGPATSAHLALARCVQWFRTGQFDRVVDADPPSTGAPLTDRRPALAHDLLRAQSLLRLGRAEEGARALRRTLDAVVGRSLLGLLRYLTAEDLATVRDEGSGAMAAAVVGRGGLELTEVVAALRAPLTPAELEVLRLLRGGRSRKQIADALFLSLSTVKSHLHSAYRKLGVTERNAALAVLDRLGF